MGKPRQGQLLLKAVHEENHIVISVTDDGKGIDPLKIKEAAIRKGVISHEQADEMSDKELVSLIFKSGFSTAEKVSDVSGRGEGMDIVRSHIEKINGMIDIDSTPGVGTCFTIKLPLTLAIIRSLLVRLGKQIFAIPLANVLEIVRVPPDDLKTIKNEEVAIIRGKVLPLVRMSEKLGISSDSTPSKRVFVVVVGIAERRVGLVVDETLGNQEIVIKSLGKFIRNTPYIAGATIMGDGNVSMILDIASIVREEGTKQIDDELVQKHQKTEGTESQFVTFTLGNEEYGLEIGRVKDIITVPAVTKVVEAPNG